MPDGLYISYTGVAANQAELDAISNNVANASTTGYRRDQTVFDTILGAASSYARSSTGKVDLTPGSHKSTENPIHGAISGEGFFVVEADDGSEVYTRRGDFQIAADGRVVLPNGLQVKGDGGALSVPTDQPVHLTNDGTFVTEQGAVGKLKVVTFTDPSQLTKIGESVIAASPDAGIEDVDNPSINSGFVEASNVNIAAEMVQLISATRSIEASMRSLRINDELTGSLIDAQQ